MLIRRTKWSVWFLQHLYNDYRVWQQGGQRGQEQGAINQFAADQPDLFKQHTAIIAYDVFNQHRYSVHASHNLGKIVAALKQYPAVSQTSIMDMLLELHTLACLIAVKHADGFCLLRHTLGLHMSLAVRQTLSQIKSLLPGGASSTMNV